MRERTSFSSAALLAALLLLSIAYTAPCAAQTFSTRGKDFWLGFMENFANQPSQIELTIHITSDISTSGQVTIPLMGWAQSFTVPANGSTTVTIPLAAAASGSEQIGTGGIHLVADDSVSLYLLNHAPSSDDAAVIIPTPNLGGTYIATCYSDTAEGSIYPSELMVVGIEERTSVEITPTVATTAGRMSGIPFTVTLNAGESYQVQSSRDLTGTRIHASGPSGECRNVALFAGSRLSKVGPCGYGNHLVEQMFPLSTWGTTFATIPFLTRHGDLLRVVAAKSATHVLLDNAPLGTLAAGSYLDTTLEGAHLIAADQPITVAQLSRGTECDSVAEADPFLLLVSPLAQPLHAAVFDAFPSATIRHYYLNVVTRTGGIASVRLDGVPIDSAFVPLAADPGYSWTRTEITQGSHTLRADSGFFASIYAYGPAVSYGYAAGVSISRMPIGIMILTASTALGGRTFCAGSPVMLQGMGDAEITQWEWEVEGIGPMQGQRIAPTFDRPGTYRVRLRATHGGACDAVIDSVYTDLTIILPPAPSIVAPEGTSLCDLDSLVLEADRTYSSYLWSTGESTKGITVRSAGRYQLEVIDTTACSGTTTITVTGKKWPPPTLSLSCRCDGMTLTASEGYERYRWSNGDTGRVALLRGPGSYTVTATTPEGCEVTSSPMVLDSVESPLASLTAEPEMIDAAPGDTVTLRLTLRRAIPSPLCDHSRATLMLGFDETLLMPEWIEGATVVTDTAIEGQRRLTLSASSDTVVTLYLIAALGSAESTTIDAVGFAWDDCTPAPIEQPLATLHLSSLCREGGVRLFEDTDTLLLKQSRPDPASTTAEIEYSVIETGQVELLVTDAVGRAIARPVERELPPGRYVVRLDVSRYPSGIYTYTLVTPTARIERRMRVVR